MTLLHRTPALCLLASLAWLSFSCSAGSSGPDDDFNGGSGNGAGNNGGGSNGGGGNGNGGGFGGFGALGGLDDCGNGELNGEESCDDGNTVLGDGCTPGCQLELDYICPEPGQPCISQMVCGDGVLASTEACDDGNMNAGDGCSFDCLAVESGWQCRVAGRACIPLCGDGVVTPPENCDDSNATSGDGCSSTCLTEPGYSCTGTECVQSVCGNGAVEAGETCDAGNDNGLFFGDGSGCSKTCTKEPACRDGSGATGACEQVCGDGNVDLGELCDDGNLVDGDGCSMTCTPEEGFLCDPVDKPDTTPCPDGGGECLVLPIIYRDFDSSHPDFYFISDLDVPCVPNASGGKDTTGAADCWDNDSTDLCQGLAAPVLGPDGKPTLGGTTMCECRFTDWDSDLLTAADATSSCTSGAASPNRIEVDVPIVESADSFAEWYRDSANSTTVRNTLVLQPIGGGRFQFSSSEGETITDDIEEGAGATLDSGFFPLDAQTDVGGEQMCNMWPYWPNGVIDFPGCEGDQWNPDANDGNGGMEAYEGVEHNFYFTSEVRYLFKYVGGETLEFYGDDDVFVYINGQLTLDLGAPHERLRGSVTLEEGAAVATVYRADGDTTITQVPMDLVAGSTYEIAVFHADRHPRESNYQLTLQGFSTTRSECVPACGDGVATTGEECDDGPNNQDGVYGACTTACMFGPFCGDGNVDTPDEECDTGRENKAQYGDIGGCTATCTVAHYCGDGLVDVAQGEQCDLGENNGNATCSSDCLLGVK